MFKRLFALFCVGLFVAGTVLWTPGCNTMRGAGEDVESAGESIQDAAD